jgi:predicted amidohydrolase YtcJ
VSTGRERGLREAHAHLGALAEWLATPTMAGCSSIGECLAMIGDAAGRAAPGAWVRFLGARPEAWAERRWPTRAELESAAAGRPCIVKSFDHHNAVANGAALERAGLRAGDRVPPHGEVVADDRGEATGVLLEQAASAAWQAAPAMTDGARSEGIRAALAHLKGLGFNEVHDMLSQAWLGPLLAEMDDAGELGMRVWMYAPVEDAGAFVERPWERENVRLAGLKAFADGTLNSRTAYMLHAYEEPAHDRHAPAGEWRGKALMTPAQLDESLARARSMGVGLAVHAIGDGAVRMVLDARGRAGEFPERTPGGFPSLRIEHAEHVDERDVARFARMGVACSVQACHLLYDVEALTRYLPHRLERVLPLRELIGAGCAPGELLWFGSDTPIVPADPADSVWAAVERRRRDDPAAARIGPGQAVTEAEAWRCFGGGGRVIR